MGLVGKGQIQYRRAARLVGGEVSVLSWCVDQRVPCEGGAVKPRSGEGQLLRLEEPGGVGGGVVNIKVTKNECRGRAGGKGLAREDGPGRVPRDVIKIEYT